VDRAAELGVGIDEALLAIDMVYVIGTTEDFAPRVSSDSSPRGMRVA
jgi:hypothetical protein